MCRLASATQDATNFPSGRCSSDKVLSSSSCLSAKSDSVGLEEYLPCILVLDICSLDSVGHVRDQLLLLRWALWHRRPDCWIWPLPLRAWMSASQHRILDLTTSCPSSLCTAFKPTECRRTGCLASQCNFLSCVDAPASPSQVKLLATDVSVNIETCYSLCLLGFRTFRRQCFFLQW